MFAMVTLRSTGHNKFVINKLLVVKLSSNGDQSHSVPIGGVRIFTPSRSGKFHSVVPKLSIQVVVVYFGIGRTPMFNLQSAAVLA